MSRRSLDTYPSEPSMIHHLLERVRISPRQVVLEPTAGIGQLARPLKQAGLQVITNDIAYGETKWKCKRCGTVQISSEPASTFSEWHFEPCKKCGAKDNQLERERLEVKAYYTDYRFNAGGDVLWRLIPRPDWVIGNPPFNQLEDILEKSLVNSTVGVAFILRLSALEPACTRSRRGEIMEAWADNLRFVMPFSGPRPSFTGDGKTDSVTTAWFVWMHNHSWKEFIGIQSPFQFIMNWKLEAQEA